MKHWKLGIAAGMMVLAQPHWAVAQNAPPPPAGASSQVLLGAKLYQQHCALCHGVSGRDASVFPRPIWGSGHDIAKFANAKGLFEYLQLLMPFDNPAKIDDAGKTAITSYMLVRNGNMKASETLPLGGNQQGIK
jgi:mono/diheme cytochrome c family protein